jgi:hypothetical protein
MPQNLFQSARYLRWLQAPIEESIGTMLRLTANTPLPLLARHRIQILIRPITHQLTLAMARASQTHHLAFPSANVEAGCSTRSAKLGGAIPNMSVHR